MRLLVSFLCVGAFCAAAAQEAQPDFVWRGNVDGVVVLHLHGDKLEVQNQVGGPVKDQHFHFSHPLPDTLQNARLRVLEGRGFVHILEQPNINNQYTLTVSIEDRAAGRASYSIALFWDSSDRLFERPSARERRETVTWSGRVDVEALVSVQGKSCSTTAGRGSPVTAEHFRLSQPLPNQPVQLTLVDQQGRGDIRLLEQPSESNHFTARVSIRDPLPGSSDYSFTLEWIRPTAKKASAAHAGPPPSVRGPGLHWSGTVTGSVRITLKGGAAFSQALEGGRAENGHADLLTPLPARSDLDPIVKVLKGRGRVEIVERPSEENKYQLVIQISDPGPGADTYEIEADW